MHIKVSLLSNWTHDSLYYQLLDYIIIMKIHDNNYISLELPELFHRFVKGHLIPFTNTFLPFTHRYQERPFQKLLTILVNSLNEQQHDTLLGVYYVWFVFIFPIYCELNRRIWYLITLFCTFIQFRDEFAIKKNFKRLKGHYVSLMR